MKRYLEHLIEDLEELRISASQKLAFFFQVSEAGDYEPYLNEEDNGITVSELIGMDKEFFPKEDYLTDEEADYVVKSLIDVYHAHGLNPLFETCVTSRVKYAHLRNSLTQQVFPVQNQTVDVEMCDYLPQYCPFFMMCSHYNQHKVCCVLKHRA